MDNSIIQRMRTFKDWFRGYNDNFVIIGGTACSLILNTEGADFRATKDIDMVLLVEALTSSFGRRFWEYILEAEYEHCQKSTGKPQFYRFYRPKSNEYPDMIELFSRQVDRLILPADAVITPIPISDDVSSLSAILLNDEYYDFLRDGVRMIDGLPILDELHMIPFKVKAWLDLTERKNMGEGIDSKDIQKHKRDVYRMAGIIADGFKFALPSMLERDMYKFLTAAQEALVRVPPKNRATEKKLIENIVGYFGLPASVLQWKAPMSVQLARGNRKVAEQSSRPDNTQRRKNLGPERG